MSEQNYRRQDTKLGSLEAMEEAIEQLTAERDDQKAMQLMFQRSNAELHAENARLQTIIHHASQMENLDRLERDRLRAALKNLADSSSVSRANFQTDGDAANETLKGRAA